MAKHWLSTWKMVHKFVQKCLMSSKSLSGAHGTPGSIVVFMVCLGHVIAQDGHLGLEQTLAGGRL